MFAALGFTTLGVNGGGPLLAGAMQSARGVVAYESGLTGDITLGGQLKRASAGQVGVGYLLLTAQVAALLSARTAAAGALAAATDVGIFTSALSTGTDNLVSLPSNFGPGRGNWVSADAQKLLVTIAAENTSSASPTDVGNAKIWSVVVAAGNVTITVRNAGLSPVSALALDLEYRSSISV